MRSLAASNSNSNSNSSHKKQVKVVRIMKTPIRAISKALDLYVKGINNFAITYNTPLRTMEQALPRSFSTTRLSDNYDQQPEGALVRSISTASTDQINIANLELYMIQYHRHQLTSSAGRKGMPRSCSVGMGRIDEDRVASFRNENVR